MQIMYCYHKRGDFGMQLNDFNKIRMEIGRKIKQSFGNKIRGIELRQVAKCN